MIKISYMQILSKNSLTFKTNTQKFIHKTKIGSLKTMVVPPFQTSDKVISLNFTMK